MPTCKAQRHNRLTLSPMNLTTRVTTKANPKVQFTFHYGSFNEVDTEPSQPRGAHTHNSIGGSQAQQPRRPHTHNSIGGSQAQQPSRVQRPKSNKLTIFTSTNLRGEHKTMQLMQWQEHKCSSASLSNSTKATKAMGE